MISDNKQRFLECLTKKCKVEITPDLKIIAGVSGGADSVCMVLLLKEIFGSDSVICCHFNHKIRGESAERDAVFVENLAKKLGMRFELAENDVPMYAKEHGFGIEEAARKLRYDFFDRLSLKYNNALIAVAHNKNDKTETIIHNLSRGTSVDGLKGIEYRRSNVIRPLLDFTKAEIFSVCESYGVVPVFDESNNDTKYKRNLIRNKVLPFLKETLGEDFENHVLALSESATLDSEFLQKYTKDIFERICEISTRPFLKIRLNYFEFFKLDKAIQNRLIRFVLSKVKNKEGNFVFPEYTGIYSDMILRVRNSIATLSAGKFIELGSGVVCVKTSEDVYFSHESVMYPTDNLNSFLEIREKIIKKDSLAEYSKDGFEYFDADILSELYGKDFLEKIEIKRNDIDYDFRPFGMKGHKSLRKFLIDNKIGTFERAFTELVMIENDILWIPGIRRSNIAPIDKNTSRVIIIKYIP